MFEQGVELLSKIEAECSSHPIFDSPLLVAMSKRQVDFDIMQIWMSQQYQISKQFTGLLAILYGRIRNPYIAAPIIEHFILHEYWGNDEAGSHPQLFMKAMHCFGLKTDEGKLRPIVSLQETELLLQRREAYFLNEPLPAVLGAMTFGHEFVNSQIFECYWKGVSCLGWDKQQRSDVLEYFNAHVEGESADCAILKQIILSLCVAKNDYEGVRKGALDMLDIRRSHFVEMGNRFKDHLAALEPRS